MTHSPEKSQPTQAVPSLHNLMRGVDPYGLAEEEIALVEGKK